MKGSLSALLPSSLLYRILVTSIWRTSQTLNFLRKLQYTDSIHSWLQRMIQFVMSFLDRTSTLSIPVHFWVGKRELQIKFLYMIWATGDGMEIEWGTEMQGSLLTGNGCSDTNFQQCRNFHILLPASQLVLLD